MPYLFQPVQVRVIYRLRILRQDMLQYLPLILSASYEAVRGIYEAVTMV